MTFKEGKIIEKFYTRKDGKDMEIIIRYPKKSDLKDVWKFYNRVIKETEFLSRINPVTLKDEKKWMNDTISKAKKIKTVQLFAEHKGKIIASCSIFLDGHETTRHTGHYGICVLQSHTGIGLGTKLSESILRIAKKEMKIEIAQLSVYSKNKIAQNLYKKLGFRYAGKVPRGIKHRSGYMDNIFMYKVL